MNHLSIARAVPDVEVQPAKELGSDTQVRSKRGVKVNTALRFYHDVIGLEHLHYGLWNGEPRTLDGLINAQESYAKQLADWIPEGVETVLDVGSGTGATTAMLARRGFRVEGLAPDPYQQVLFRRRSSAPFHLARFQEFAPTHPFDLVLMSESAQYIWLPDFFPSTLRTAPGGWLLVSDYFRVGDDLGPHASSGHRLDDFMELAGDHGVELDRSKDVTELVKPTLDLARGWLDRYVEPTIRLLVERYPTLTRIGRWMTPSLLQKYEDIKVYVDGEAFCREKRYLILLFRVPG
jgi:MPBQ/MSBQ methyltransferase